MHSVSIYPEKESVELTDYFELAKENPLYIEFYKEYKTAEEAPMLSKKELLPILKNKFNIHSEKTGVYLVRSGGSTQSPLVFPVDIQENQKQRLALAAELTKHDFFMPKTIALNIFGYSDMYRTAAIMDDILEKCNSTTLALSSHATYEDMEYAAHYFKPDFIMGTPSKLLCFAQFLEENNQKLEIENLLYGGEFLRPNIQKFLQKTFGTKQIYSLYGSAETGIWAWCNVTENPSLFSVIKGIIIEIMNPDSEGYGTIAVTNTFRKRFPVFRYAIGDLGRWTIVDGKPFLELKSRESKSFIVSEQHYDLEDFTFLTKEATAFQIQLSSTKELKESIRLLLVQDVLSNQLQDFLEEKSEILKRILNFDERFMEVEVLQIKASDLYIDPNTTKAPLILDLRM
ncbi:hypothetical protein ACFFLS_18320 [Flavobacterium procerum]|uniref:Phenylacetate-CoA ligase n=1 Tax=Flavobacterium procerum TaxID=1455569 RepID=A0ABV6BU97_9FLAO